MSCRKLLPGTIFVFNVDLSLMSAFSFSSGYRSTPVDLMMHIYLNMLHDKNFPAHSIVCDSDAGFSARKLAKPSARGKKAIIQRATVFLS